MNICNICHDKQWNLVSYQTFINYHPKFCSVFWPFHLTENEAGLSEFPYLCQFTYFTNYWLLKSTTRKRQNLEDFCVIISMITLYVWRTSVNIEELIKVVYREGFKLKLQKSKKSNFAQNSVKYLRHTLNNTGKPHHHNLKSIKQFPKPQNKMAQLMLWNHLVSKRILVSNFSNFRSTSNDFSVNGC